MKCGIVYKMFFKPGEVTEIRAFGLRGKNKSWDGYAGGAGIVFGYFDNADDFERAAESLDEAGVHSESPVNIYFTLNPCLPDMIARAPNRLITASKEGMTTGDKHIKLIRWLPVDIDALYPHKLKISSTDEEIKYTLQARNEIYKFLKENGFEDPIPACSGNGAHLAYKLEDFEINVESDFHKLERVQNIKSTLIALSQKFNNKNIEVDTGVDNPARIWRLYGTTARKGFNMNDRPWRRSYIEPKFLENIKNNNTS